MRKLALSIVAAALAFGRRVEADRKRRGDVIRAGKVGMQ